MINQYNFISAQQCTQKAKVWKQESVFFNQQQPRLQPHSDFPVLFSWNGKLTMANILYNLRNEKGTSEQLNLSVLMLYNLKLQHYKKKQSIVLLNLLSNSRPNDPKLVGRFEIDLATIANKNNLNQLAQYPLKYCSVKGSITLKASLRQQKITTIDPSDFERSECSQIQIFGQEIGSHKEDAKGSVSSLNASSVETKQRITPRNELQNPYKALNEFKSSRYKEAKEAVQIVHCPPPKKQVRIEIENNEYKSQSNGLEVEGGLEKRLKNDFSIPRLVKNSSQFDSSKMNSQKTLKNLVSQKSLSKFPQSPKVQQQPSNQFSKKSIQEDVIHQISNVNLEIRPSEVEEVKIQDIQNQKKQQERHPEEDIQKLNQQKKTQEKRQQQLRVTQKDLSSGIFQIAKITRQMEQKERSFQQQYLKFNSQLQQINLKNKELQQLNQQLKAIIKQEQSKQNSKYLQLNDKYLELQHKYQTEIQNHKNTQLELDQLKEWYTQLQKQKQRLQQHTAQIQNNQNTRTELKQVKEKYSQLQQQKQKLSEERQELFLRIEQLIQKQDKYQAQNVQWQNIKKNHDLELQTKILEIETLKKQSEEKDRAVDTLQQKLGQFEIEVDTFQQRLVESQLQLQKYQQKLALEQQKVRSLCDNNTELNENIGQLTINLEQKQIECLELSQQLRIIKQSNIQLEKEIQDYKKISSNSQKQKEQVMEQRQKRLKDLVARMKEKEEAIAKLQRQKQQVQFKIKQLQFTSEQYKQKLKKQEQEKVKLVQKSNTLQKENKQILRELQIVNRKILQDAENFNKNISKLKQNLEEETQKSNQKERKLKEIQSSKMSQMGNNKQSETKINNYMQRESILKENLQIVQNQLSKIADILVQKEQNQEYFNQTILSLNQANSQLNLKISEVQHQLATNKQRCEALEAQVQLLNSYMPQEQDQTQLVEMNRRLNDKNKQLLEIIEQQNRVLALLQKNEESNKFSEAKQQLANSRQLKQMAGLQNKVIVLQDQNEKAYKEVERLNTKYAQELAILQSSNEQRVKELVSTIQLKDIRIKSLQIKDWENFNQSKMLKEQLQKTQESLNQKQFQLEIYKNQIKQQNETIQSLQSQLNVLNLQYQNVYSQMGQKQFQLYETNGKLKQLQQAYEAKVDIANQMVTVDEQKKKYEIKINQLEEKYSSLMNQNKDLLNQQKGLLIQRQQLKLKVEQLKQVLNKANLQLQTYKSNQKEYEQKINQIQYEQKVVISSLKEAQQKQHIQNEKLSQRILQLETEINNLKTELIVSKQNINIVQEQKNKEVAKQSLPTTPIQQFKQSPSPNVSNQKQNVNLKDIVEELTTIINTRKSQDQVEGVLRLVIDKNQRQEEQFLRWNRQRGAMQEKAKIASKQLQKAKSAIMKNTNRSIAQKSQITGLLRPIEGVIGQLIQLSQTLSELDLDAQYNVEEQQMIDQKQEVRV